MKNKARVGIIVLILLLSIGFASVTTNLILNGTARVASSQLNGLVYFVQATPEQGGTATLSSGNTVIDYTTKTLTNVGDKAELYYVVLNDSSQYDADVSMSVELTNSSLANEYLTITYEGFEPAEQGNDHTVNIKGKAVQNGKITIELKKVSVDPIDIGLTITLDVKAVERSSTATQGANSGYYGPGHNYNYTSCDHSHDGELAYFDPVTENVCSKDTFSVSGINNQTSTCYAWRVINYCDGEYVMQLDHNLAYSIWNNQNDYAAALNIDISSLPKDEYIDGGNETGPITMLKKLETVTSTWTRLDPINYTYSNVVDIATGGRGFADVPLTEGGYGVLNCNKGVCTVSNNPTYAFTSLLRARVITYEDIISIYGNNNPTKFGNINKNYDALIISSTGYGNNNLNAGNSMWWLLENTLGSDESVDPVTGGTPSPYVCHNPVAQGENINTDYWTLSPGIKTPGIVGEGQVGYTQYVIGIDNEVYLSPWNQVGGAQFHWTIAAGGIRPVVSVPAAQVRLHNEN